MHRGRGEGADVLEVGTVQARDEDFSLDVEDEAGGAERGQFVSRRVGRGLKVGRGRTRLRSWRGVRARVDECGLPCERLVWVPS